MPSAAASSGCSCCFPPRASTRRFCLAPSPVRLRRWSLHGRLNRGYIETLERNLLNRALELDLSDVEDVTTRTVMLQDAPTDLAVEGPQNDHDHHYPNRAI